MSARTMRLGMGILFLVMGLALLCRQWLFPNLLAGYDPLRMSLGALLAMVFGGLNLARYYAATVEIEARQTPVRTPLQRDPTTPDGENYHPEFDFTSRGE